MPSNNEITIKLAEEDLIVKAHISEKDLQKMSDRQIKAYKVALTQQNRAAVKIEEKRAEKVKIYQERQEKAKEQRRRAEIITQKNEEKFKEKVVRKEQKRDIRSSFDEVQHKYFKREQAINLTRALVAKAFELKRQRQDYRAELATYNRRRKITNKDSIAINEFFTSKLIDEIKEFRNDFGANQPLLNKKLEELADTIKEGDQLSTNVFEEKFDQWINFEEKLYDSLQHSKLARSISKTAVNTAHHLELTVEEAGIKIKERKEAAKEKKERKKHEKELIKQLKKGNYSTINAINNMESGSGLLELLGVTAGGSLLTKYGGKLLARGGLLGKIGGGLASVGGLLTGASVARGASSSIAKSSLEVAARGPSTIGRIANFGRSATSSIAETGKGLIGRILPSSSKAAPAVGRLGKMSGAASGAIKGGLGKIPLLGGLLVGALEYNDSGSIGRAIGTGVGDLGGSMAGAAAGAALGSFVPVVGTAIGGIIGGIAGAMIGDHVGSEAGGAVESLITGKEVTGRQAEAATLNETEVYASNVPSSSATIAQLSPSPGTEYTLINPTLNFPDDFVFNVPKDSMSDIREYWKDNQRAASVFAGLPQVYSPGSVRGPVTRNYMEATSSGSSTAQVVETATPKKVKEMLTPIPTLGKELGSLSARFESSGDSSAIGYDSVGGTSYGKYQIATKPGTMNNFMDFLAKDNPTAYIELAQLRGSMGDKSGDFAKKWKELASSGALKNSEHAFIKKTHYDAAYQKLSDSARKMVDNNPALQEALWSTSVQHGAGGASSIFNKTYNESPETYISNIYAERGTKFGSSTPSVQQAVRNRFEKESQLVLQMQKEKGTVERKPEFEKAIVSSAQAVTDLPKNLLIDKPSEFTGLNATVQANLRAMADEYEKTTGKPLKLNEGFRTYEEQQALYNDPRYKAAKPGTSLHEFGYAVDIKPEQAIELDKAGLLEKYGFYRPMAHDPKEVQHIEPIGISKKDMKAKIANMPLAEGAEKYIVQEKDVQSTFASLPTPEASTKESKALIIPEYLPTLSTPQRVETSLISAAPRKAVDTQLQADLMSSEQIINNNGMIMPEIKIPPITVNAPQPAMPEISSNPSRIGDAGIELFRTMWGE